LYKLAYITDHGNFTVEEAIEELENLSFELFVKFSKEFFSVIRLEFMVIGNID